VSARRETSPGAAPQGQGRTAPTWVKLLVGFHVLATTIWALPNLDGNVMSGTVSPHASQWLLYWNQRYLKPTVPIQTYLTVTGGWQYWDMFAPNPSNIDWYGDAEVTYRDGSKRIVDYPRISKLPISLKYVKERYRKFYERAHNAQEPFLFPTFAQAMALRAFTDRSNPPTIVTLRSHSLAIAPPGQPQPKEYSTGIYYTYAVDERWLEKAASGK